VYSSIGRLEYTKYKGFYRWEHASLGELNICGFKKFQPYYRMFYNIKKINDQSEIKKRIIKLIAKPVSLKKSCIVNYSILKLRK